MSREEQARKDLADDELGEDEESFLEGYEKTAQLDLEEGDEAV